MKNPNRKIENRCFSCGKLFEIDIQRAYRYKYRGTPEKNYCSTKCKNKPKMVQCSLCGKLTDHIQKYANGMPCKNIVLCTDCNKKDYDEWMFNPTIPLHDLTIFGLNRSEICKKFNITSTILQQHIEFYGIESLFDYTCYRCNKLFYPTPAQKKSVLRGENIYCRNCLPKGKATFDKQLGHIIRSSYEKTLGLWLQKKEISYEYEPQGFKTPFGYYYPDFYIELHNTYIEVKGRFNLKSIKKFQYFMNRQQIILLMQKEINLIKKDLNSCKLNFSDLQKFSEKNIQKIKNNAFCS